MSDLYFDLAELKVPAFVVGGWVRDRLLPQQCQLKNIKNNYWDWDFVLPSNAVETAKAIAQKHNAGFVLLDQARQIARVVFASGTADFAQQMGATIAEDLGRRDFAMNAIAIDCEQLKPLITNLTQDVPNITELLIDPFSGQQDIHHRRIRLINAKNIKDDPLRILRAYRQAAKLGFDLEPVTQKCLVELATGLKNIAAERVRTELSYLLAMEVDGTKWFVQAAEDRIFESWIPYKNLRLPRLALVDGAIAQVVDDFPELEPYFKQILSSDRSVTVVIKFAGLSASATALEPLGFSRVEQRWIVTLLRLLPQLLGYLQSQSVSATEQYQLFTATTEVFPALAVLAIASHPAEDQNNLKANLRPWLLRWLDSSDPLAHLVPLLNGDDLKIELGLSSGNKIGEILNLLKLAQVEQLITNRQEAVSYAHNLLLM